MRPDLEREILDRVGTVVSAQKTISGAVDWSSAPSHRPNHCLELVVPLLIQGVSSFALQARLNVRADMPERDVYGQLEMWCPEIERFLHFERIEWRPNRPHTNPFTAPANLRGKKLFDRHHAFRENRRIGLPGLLQTVPLIGVELPNHIETFTDFMGFLGTVWRIDNPSFPVPPWQARFL